MAFGKIRLRPDDFWVMTPREFYNAWLGWRDARREEWNVHFYNAQYNASRTTMSKEQARQIQRDKPPWEQQTRRKSKKLMDGRTIAKMLSFISQPAGEA